MRRITRKDLQMQVDCINEELGLPAKAYIEVEGKLIPQAKCYLLDYTYAGASLHQMSPIEGCTGVVSIFRPQTKNELMNSLIAFRAGITAGRKK